MGEIPQLETFAIAIDGPGGAGKSTVAKALANRLNILYMDTGAMYRACGLQAERLGLDKHQVKEIEAMLQKTRIDVRFVDDRQHVFLNDEDVTDLIRTPSISIWASDISAIPACRQKMVELQRAIAAQRSVVMDGRDIGSYVLPNADLKIYLTATVDVRAKRRYDELMARGNLDTTLEQVAADLNYRDEQDANRAFAPLKKTADAHEIDTTHLNIDEVVARIIQLFHQHCTQSV